MTHFLQPCHTQFEACPTPPLRHVIFERETGVETHCYQIQYDERFFREARDLLIYNLTLHVRFSEVGATPRKKFVVSSSLGAPKKFVVSSSLGAPFVVSSSLGAPTRRMGLAEEASFST